MTTQRIQNERTQKSEDSAINLISSCGLAPITLGCRPCDNVCRIGGRNQKQKHCHVGASRDFDDRKRAPTRFADRGDRDERVDRASGGLGKKRETSERRDRSIREETGGRKGHSEQPRHAFCLGPKTISRKASRL